MSIMGRILIGVFFCFASCIAYAQRYEFKVESPDSVPRWLNHLPGEESFIYAIGVVGRTYYYEDGIVKAADAARKELAKSLAGHVEDFVFVLETTKGLETAKEVYTVQATTWATDIVMKEAEVIAFWVDGNGLVGEKGATYALGRLYSSKIGESKYKSTVNK